LCRRLPCPFGDLVVAVAAVVGCGMVSCIDRLHTPSSSSSCSSLLLKEWEKGGETEDSRFMRFSLLLTSLWGEFLLVERDGESRSLCVVVVVVDGDSRGRLNLSEKPGMGSRTSSSPAPSAIGHSGLGCMQVPPHAPGWYHR